VTRTLATRVALIVSPVLAAAAPLAAGPRDALAKIDAQLLAEARTKGVADFLVVLEEQADLAVAQALPGRVAKGQAVVAALQDTALRSQRSLRHHLRQAGVPHRPFWVANMVWVRADAGLIEKLAARDEVRHIAANAEMRMELPAATKTRQTSAVTQAIPWGVERIGAPLAWSQGIDGSGIVIGGQDTGYDWTHPALRDHYLGWDGATADHNYHWHDAIHSATANPCGVDSRVPCDDGEHGTHTMGTMVGSDGGQNPIGVAPGARWIGCRNMDKGAGTPATYAECFEWFLAPTDLAGQNPDPRRAPHVINNSWGCTRGEGCTDPAILAAVVNAVRAAGIVVVVSAGNSGPRCGSVSNPAAIYDASFTVGATGPHDEIANFSSRGPVTADGSSRPKPDVVAPGVNVLSSTPGNGYQEFNGTSMAGPHVAGLVALLLQARPELDGNVTAIEQILRDTAVPLSSSEDCGATAGLIPNNTFGAGRVDALAAVNSTGGAGFFDEFDDGKRATDWTYRGASWREQHGDLTASGGETIAKRAFAGCSQCTVTARLEVGAGRGGSASLIGWQRDASHFVELRLLESEDRWLLLQKDGSKTAQASAAATIAAGVAYEVSIEFDGAEFTVHIDGERRLGLAKIPSSTPAGTVGFKVNRRAARFARIAAQ
jgi:serine protease AprX